MQPDRLPDRDFAKLDRLLQWTYPNYKQISYNEKEVVIQLYTGRVIHTKACFYDLVKKCDNVFFISEAFLGRLAEFLGVEDVD